MGVGKAPDMAELVAAMHERAGTDGQPQGEQGDIDCYERVHGERWTTSGFTMAETISWRMPPR
jgi:hypothetical protein